MTDLQAIDLFVSVVLCMGTKYTGTESLAKAYSTLINHTITLDY